MRLEVELVILVFLNEFIAPSSHAGWETPPVPPPVGATVIVRDTCANFWTLARGRDGRQQLWVLPAQEPNRWSETTIPGLDAGQWESLVATADGAVNLTLGSDAVSFNPRDPAAGIHQVSSAVTAPATPGPWRVMTRMPASNHDLSAAVVDDFLYVAGGLTAEWGYPARSHAFNELWALDARTWTWRIAAKFPQPRIYCATVAFQGRVWIVGGDVVSAEGRRRSTTSATIFDPKTGIVVAGPDLPVAQPAPLALVARKRLYVMGTANRESPGRMDSIGPDETSWRREPDGPPRMWALAGAAWENRLYVAVPHTGLAVFDPETRRWNISGGPTHPRSPQVAAWRGEIWLIGGRDIAKPRDTRIFNPRTLGWRSGPPLDRELAWGAAAVVQDQIVVTGGAAGPCYSDRTYVLQSDLISP
jgi:hypothetical protein